MADKHNRSYHGHTLCVRMWYERARESEAHSAWWSEWNASTLRENLRTRGPVHRRPLDFFLFFFPEKKNFFLRNWTAKPPQIAAKAC